MAGEAWNKLTPEEQAPYRKMAYEAKLRHEKQHPGYRYTPLAHDASPPPRKTERKVDDAEERRCRAIAEFLIQGLTGPELASAIDQLNEGLVQPSSHTLPHAPSPPDVSKEDDALVKPEQDSSVCLAHAVPENALVLLNIPEPTASVTPQVCSNCSFQ